MNETSRPKKVGTAVTLLYTALGIGAVRYVMSAAASRPMVSTASVVLMILTLAVIGIMWLLISKISIGRNWARISLLALFVLGVLGSIFQRDHFLGLFSLSRMLGLCQAVLQFIAFVFLFLKPSSAWFRKIKDME